MLCNHFYFILSSCYNNWWAAVKLKRVLSKNNLSRIPPVPKGTNVSKSKTNKWRIKWPISWRQQKGTIGMYWQWKEQEIFKRISHNYHSSPLKLLCNFDNIFIVSVFQKTQKGPPPSSSVFIFTLSCWLFLYFLVQTQVNCFFDGFSFLPFLFFLFPFFCIFALFGIFAFLNIVEFVL